MSEHVKAAVALLMVEYPNQQWSQERMKLWNELLSDIDPETLMLATKDYITTNETGFCPNIGQLRNHAGKLIAYKNGLPVAADAWAEIQQKIKQVGYYRPMPEFSHPLIAEVVQAMGGWRQLCSSNNNVSDRARFMSDFWPQILKRETMKIVRLPEIKMLAEGKRVKELSHEIK